MRSAGNGFYASIHAGTVDISNKSGNMIASWQAEAAEAMRIANTCPVKNASINPASHLPNVSQ